MNPLDELAGNMNSMNSHVHSQIINVWCASVHRGMVDDQPQRARRVVIAEKPVSNDLVDRHANRVLPKVCVKVFFFLGDAILVTVATMNFFLKFQNA